MLRFFLALLTVAALHAETGYDAWLRYARLNDSVLRQVRSTVPATLVVIGDSEVLGSARGEMLRGVRGILGHTLRVGAAIPADGAIVIGTADEIRRRYPELTGSATIPADGFWLKSSGRSIVIAGGNDRGTLYGAFALLRKIATGKPVARLDERESPSAPVRWVNHWDNLDGTIERGYGGRSIFWDSGHVRADLTRVRDYARLLASVGINGCSVNNVNADRRILSPEMRPELSKIAAAMRPWGVRMAISVDFGSPKSIGGLETFDPLDPAVIAWWKARIDELYAAIPDLGGVVMKADSEGRVGPSAYGRSHADAANLVARALKPHSGLVFYRGFVYDHHMDWNNPKNDRARAADDNFRPLDGKFDENAVIQIKHGPIDFQVREPASPLFGTLEKTTQAIELQITQEYFGQARHTVFLVPMWKETLDFDMRARDAATPVKAIVSGRVFGHRGGFVGVSNVGLAQNWLGNHLSQGNLYGFGRLAWNPDLTGAAIAAEWTQQTFGLDPRVDSAVEQILNTSWRTFENYTGPLGLQTLTDIVGNHYGVAVEASERNGWGQWHRADAKGVGMDRTAATGTGYIGQYRAGVAKVYESARTTPDDLLLFLHHVPYTYRLHSGKTVIQSLYDSHYEGADAVAGYERAWSALKGLIDDERFDAISQQLQYQAGNAQVWRDAVAGWFHKESGIEDAKGRVGHHPARIEAEAMELHGYAQKAVIPWETASGGTAIVCGEKRCEARTPFDGKPGWYAVHVRYFDLPTGAARFRLYVGDQPIDEWIASELFPARKLDGTSSMLRSVRGVALRPGDVLRIEGVPDGNDPAGLDYMEIVQETK